MTPAKSLFPLLAGFASSIYWLYSQYGKLNADKQALEAFAKLDTRNMTAEQIWNEALSFSKARRIHDNEIITELQTLCHSAEDTLRLAEGLKNLASIHANPDVPEFVKIELAEVWLSKFLRTYGFDPTALQKEFADLKAKAKPHPDDHFWRWAVMRAKTNRTDLKKKVS